jgi:hypothetical protein
MKFLRERQEEGHNFKTKPTLCAHCSDGCCPSCGEQFAPGIRADGTYSWDDTTGCSNCGESVSSGGQAALLSQILGKSREELQREKGNKTATNPRTGSHLGFLSFDVPDNVENRDLKTHASSPATGITRLGGEQAERL